MNIELLEKGLPSGTDAALIISPENRRYFTDFPSSDGILAVTATGSIFYTDSRYIEAAEKTITCCDVAEGKKQQEQLRDFFNAHGVKTVAVESSRMTVSQLKNLENSSPLSSFTFISDSALDCVINGIRSVKNETEISYLRKAQAITEAGFDHILGYIEAGRTEKDVQLELDYFMLKNGAEALSFETIAVSGVNSSMPHGVPSDKVIENGDFLTLDFGAVYGGYHADMTRTVAVGHVSDFQKEIYGIVLEAQLAVINTVRAGVSCFDADKAARDIITAAGYGNNFGHGTGHSVGIEIHESPSLNPRSKAVLKKGNVVTDEPGIYLPSQFGVRIEDMLLITEDGCENLTSAPKELIIL